MDEEETREDAPRRPNTGAGASFLWKLALVGGALSAAYASSLSVWTHVFAASLAALVLLLFLSRDPGRHIVAASGLLVAAPLLHFAAKLGMDARITADPLSCACSYCIDAFSLEDFSWPFRHPDGWFAALAPFVFPLVGAIGVAIASLMLRVRRGWGGRALRAASLASLLLAAVVLLLAFVRARRLPTLETYLSSLPVVGVLPPAQGEPAEVIDRGGKWPATLHVYRDHVDGMAIERSCNVSMRRCEVSIGPRSCQFLFERSAALTVRREYRGRAFVTLDDGSRHFAFFDGQLAHLKGTMVDEHVSPPRVWMIAGLLGMLLALELQVRRHRARKYLDWLRGAKTAPRLGIYRDGQSPDSAETTPGTPDEAIEEARREVIAYDVLSVAAAWVGVAPLIPMAAKVLGVG